MELRDKKKNNTDALVAAAERKMELRERVQKTGAAGTHFTTQFTCFSGTKVQILTP